MVAIQTQQRKSILPTQKTEPTTSFSALKMLIYGEPKIGKSTFCSQIDNAIFLATEQGLNHLSTYQIPVESWETLTQAFGELSQKNHPFRTVVIDTIDNAYSMCADYIARTNGATHIANMDYGRGYALAKSEFARVLVKFAAMGFGIVFVSHAIRKEVTGLTGSRTMIVPTMDDRAHSIISPMVDIIGFCTTVVQQTQEGYVEQRVIKTKPSLMYEAGDRTGLLPDELPLDFNALLPYLAQKEQEKIR